MKVRRIAMFAIILSLISNCCVFAEEVPKEAIPPGATLESINIVEDLLGGILDEVSCGMGYDDAWAQSGKVLRNAILAGKTGGYGYGILAGIARNSIYEYRDIYLRPEFYAEAEGEINDLIADLICDVQNDGDYREAKKKAYIRIYQMADPNFDPAGYDMIDFCYWDVPPIDTALLRIARKLLLNAESR